MNYGIRIEYKHEYQKMMKGIYKITFGHRFYIGKSKMLCKRAYQHQQSINLCLRQYPMPKNRYSSYWRIARYLHENPKIEVGYIEIIQRCISELDLYNAENSLLKDYEGNPDCLNGAFYNTRTGLDDTSLWDAKVIERIVYYFDPTKPEVKYHQYTPLRANGDFATPKPTKVSA